MSLLMFMWKEIMPLRSFGLTLFDYNEVADLVEQKFNAFKSWLNHIKVI